MNDLVVDAALGELADLQQQLMSLLGKVETTFRKLRNTSITEGDDVIRQSTSQKPRRRKRSEQSQTQGTISKALPPPAEDEFVFDVERPRSLEFRDARLDSTLSDEDYRPPKDWQDPLLSLKLPSRGPSRRGSMQEALALTLEQFQAGGQLTLSHVPSARHSTANLCEREEPDMKSAVLELPLDNFDIKSAVLELPLDNLPAFKSSPSLGNDLKGAGNVKSSKVHLNVPERQDTTLQKRISRQYMYMPKFNANGSIASLHPSKLFPSNTVLNLGVSSESLTREKGPKNRFFIGIHPRSVFASVWDVFMTGVYCTLIWFVPISTCFEKNAHLEPFVAGVSTCMFALDIIKILLTKRIRIDRNNAIKDKKVHPAGKSAFNGVARDEVEVLLSLRESQRQYLGRIFFLDILYTIPWNLILRGHIPNAWLLLFVKMFRLWRLPVLLKTTPHFLYLRRNIEISLGGGRTLWNLAVLLTCLLAFLHLEGCLFFLIGRLTNYANSPLADSIGSTLLDQYAEAMFYAVSNTVPVAFKPSDAAHQWVILILAMSGAALYAMIIGTVSSFTNSFDASGKIYRQKMDELNDYMNWKCLPDELRTKMRHYYALKYRGKFFEESSLLETLNESLRNEIAVHNCKELIDQVPFLQRSVDDGRSDSFVGRIAKSMVACFYVKGDVICTEGEMGMEMYFIVSGQVNVIVNKRQCAVLKGGQFFGELSMVAMIPRTATIIAGAPSVLYKLNRDNFIPILQDFDDVREKVAEIYKERIERLKLEEAARTLPDSSFPGTSTITNTETPYTTRVPVILQASSQMDPTFLLSTESLLPRSRAETAQVMGDRLFSNEGLAAPSLGVRATSNGNLAGRRGSAVLRALLSSEDVAGEREGRMRGEEGRRGMSVGSQGGVRVGGRGMSVDSYGTRGTQGASMVPHRDSLRNGSVTEGGERSGLDETKEGD